MHKFLITGAVLVALSAPAFAQGMSGPSQSGNGMSGGSTSGPSQNGGAMGMNHDGMAKKKPMKHKKNGSMSGGSMSGPAQTGNTGMSEGMKPNH